MKFVCATVLLALCAFNTPALSYELPVFGKTFQTRDIQFLQPCSEIYQPIMDAIKDEMTETAAQCRSSHTNAISEINEAFRPQREENERQANQIQESLALCNPMEDMAEYFGCTTDVSNQNTLTAITMSGNSKKAADEMARKKSDINKDFDTCTNDAMQKSVYDTNNCYLEWQFCNLYGPPPETTTTTEKPTNTPTETTTPAPTTTEPTTEVTTTPAPTTEVTTTPEPTTEVTTTIETTTADTTTEDDKEPEEDLSKFRRFFRKVNA